MHCTITNFALPQLKLVIQLYATENSAWFEEDTGPCSVDGFQALYAVVCLLGFLHPDHMQETQPLLHVWELRASRYAGVLTHMWTGELSPVPALQHPQQYLAGKRTSE